MSSTTATEWSTRTVVLCRAILDAAAPYPIREGLLYASPAESPSDLLAYTVDIRHSADSVEDAFVRGIDLVDQFVDVLALASYGAAFRHQTTVTRTPKVTEDAPGLLAVLGNYHTISPVEVQPDDIAAFAERVAEDSHVAIALRHLRDGLSARHAGTAQWNHLAAVEAIASAESTTRVTRTCSECGAQNYGDKEAMPLLRNFFEQFGSTSAEAAKQRGMRSRTVHGASLRDVAAQNSISPLVGVIEPVAIRLLANRSGVRPATTIGLVTGLPIAVYDLLRDSDGNLSTRAKTWETGAAAPRIPVSETHGRDRRVQLGLKFSLDAQAAAMATGDSVWA